MRCPVCRADNDLQPVCRRCRADLAVLVELEQVRSQALSLAAQRLAQGDGGTALTVANHAHRLRAGPDSVRLLALAHLLRRDFARAFQCYVSYKSAVD